jgi:cytochrome c553
MKPFIKVSSLVFFIGISVIFNGCSSDDSKTEKATKSKVTTSAGIEVVKNLNANAVKVEEKDANTSKDKSYYLDYGVKSAYSQDSRPANEDASVRISARSNIDANMHVRSPYENVQVSMIANKLSKKFIVKCSACHSDYANGVIGPSLLGKSSEFIYEKISKFKKDKTLNVLMSGLLENMSDTELKEMADEIYKFNLDIQNMRNKK